MRKYLILLLALLSIAAAPTRVSNYEPNTTISSDDVTANENALFNYVQAGISVFEDGSIVNADINASANIQSDKLNLNSVTQNISSTGTVTASSFTGGGALPSGAVFFMASGSCPSWTTDVSATYANKFIKINSTQLTSSGTVLTGTVDSHTLTTPEIPSHTHPVPTTNDSNSGGTGGIFRSDAAAEVGIDVNTSATGGAGGHTHTLSAATTLEPSSITMKACQVN